MATEFRKCAISGQTKGDFTGGRNTLSTLVIVSLLLVFCPIIAQAQQLIPIWGDESPPYSKSHKVEEYEAECWGEAVCAYQVVNATLTLYIPDAQTNRNAVIILPGGGYEVEAIYHEGFEIAKSLARRGTVAAVLKYRLPNPDTATHPEKVPVTDVRQAIKLLRQSQGKYGFSADRVGVMGFSAGSHLATVAGLYPAAEITSNPDFSMLIYGVTRLTPENLTWLEKTLYHRPLTTEEIDRETLLERVTTRTPPAFLVHALDDETCHYTETTLYAEQLIEHGVDAEMHLFPRGGHGFGPGRAEDGTDQWLGLAANWLDRLGATSE